MQQFFEFVLRHWDLWLILVVLVALALHLETSNKVFGIPMLSPQDVTQLINHENAIVVDIRDQEAFNKGHILGAINIPMKSESGEIKKLQKRKDKPIIISCANGNLSPRYGANLRKQSFSKLFALKGGIDAWQKANLPLAKVE